LEKIQEDPKSFYKGLLANSIASDIIRAEGIVDESDLSAYQTVEREPLQSNLSGMTMYLTPPPTSGAVLGLILNILKGGLHFTLKTGLAFLKGQNMKLITAIPYLLG